MVSLSQEAKKELASELDKKIKRKGSISASGNTEELILITREVIESVKEIKEKLETELSELQKQFQKKEEEISYLGSRMQELASSNRKQNEKIMNTFSRLFPEKELLQELITTHLEFK